MKEPKLTKEEEAQVEEVKKRILAFMYYKGYVGDNAINEDVMVEQMEKEGWFDIPMEQIKSLVRIKEKKEEKIDLEKKKVKNKNEKFLKSTFKKKVKDKIGILKGGKK